MSYPWAIQNWFINNIGKKNKVWVGKSCYKSIAHSMIHASMIMPIMLIIIKLGVQLGGATKELLPNLDTYKNNEKSIIPLRFLFFGGWFGKQICSFLCVLRPPSSVRAAVRQDTSRDWRFFGDQKSRIPSWYFLCGAPPKCTVKSVGQNSGRGTWLQKIPSSSPLAKNSDRGTWLQKKYHRASVRPGGRPSRYKSWLAFLGGPKIQNSVLTLFVRSTSKTHGHADINRKTLFFSSKIFINFGFCRKYARSGTIL